MSHFAVLVIGENPDKQLAPYHEFECTGVNDQYVQDIDITDKIRALMTREEEPMSLNEALEYHGLVERVIQMDLQNLGTQETNEAKIDREGKHKYGYAFVCDGLLIKAVNRTNPNKKWDWYVLGGRYTGRFKLKAGLDMRHGVIGRPGLMTEVADSGYVDSTLKQFIDFEGMRAEKEQEARERYRSYFAMLTNNNLEFPTAWNKIREKHGENIKAAREEYNNQPAIKKGNELREFLSFFQDPAKEFGCTEDQYAQLARNQAFGAFAVVKDGQWYERGTMGWWGIVHDEKDEDTWLDKFAELTDSLSDDTLLSMYDCHI